MFLPRGSTFGGVGLWGTRSSTIRRLLDWLDHSRGFQRSSTPWSHNLAPQFSWGWHLAGPRSRSSRLRQSTIPLSRYATLRALTVDGALPYHQLPRFQGPARSIMLVSRLHRGLAQACSCPAVPHLVASGCGGTRSSTIRRLRVLALATILDSARHRYNESKFNYLAFC